AAATRPDAAPVFPDARLPGPTARASLALDGALRLPGAAVRRSRREKRPTMLANFLSELKLPPGWEQWGIVAACLAVAGLAFVVARRVFTRPVVAPPPRPAEAPRSDHDPFDVGSLSEKRAALRRRGSSVELLVTDERQLQPPRPGWVLDRSVGGLGITSACEVAVGTVLKVKPKNGPPATPWVEVEGRSCRRAGG